MTDPVRVPGAVAAAWSSGSSTLATGSGAFVTGSGWGPWDGALVMGGLKSQQLIFLRLSADGQTVTAQAFGLKISTAASGPSPRPPTARCSSPRTTVPPTGYCESPHKADPHVSGVVCRRTLCRSPAPTNGTLVASDRTSVPFVQRDSCFRISSAARAPEEIAPSM